MGLNIFKFFTPQDRKFFPLFERAAENLVQTSNKLNQMLNESDSAKRIEIIREIERLEHIGDQITHETFNELSANFITPFDREDIHTLVTSLDDIIDYIHGAAKRIELYNLDTITPAMIKLGELIQRCVDEIYLGIVELKNLKNKQKIKEVNININAIENHADDIFDNAIARLFEEEKDAVKIIKIKEILSALETATDKCEDVANVFSTIFIKNA